MPRKPNLPPPAVTERLHLQIDRDLVRALRHEAAERRVSIRSLVQSAIADRYDPERQLQGQHEVIKEIRGLRRSMQQLSEGHGLLAELTTLGLRNVVACLPPPTPVGQTRSVEFYRGLTAAVEANYTQGVPLLQRLLATVMQVEEPELENRLSPETAPASAAETWLL